MYHSPLILFLVEQFKDGEKTLMELYRRIDSAEVMPAHWSKFLTEAGSNSSQI